MSIKNDGHYFCRAGGNRPDGLNEPVTCSACSVRKQWKLRSSKKLWSTPLYSSCANLEWTIM
nr:hypothetical protein [Escherichia coli]